MSYLDERKTEQPFLMIARFASRSSRPWRAKDWIPSLPIRLALGLGVAIAALGVVPNVADAMQANIRIKGTAPEMFANIRPVPNTTQNPIGRIPEGASPEYNCFTYGQVINGVPVWFSVNYGGVTGFYASYYDDSSYRSEAELTGKYGIPKCGSIPPSAPAPGPTPAPPSPAAAPPPPTPAARPKPASPPPPAEQVLPPDPAFWCVQHPPFQTQVREAGWKVLYKGLEGTRGQNNWRCRFLVVTTVPTGKNSFTFSPIWFPVNIDFNATCQEQFPGSRLRYQLGPVYSTPWPWQCIGDAGKYYPPPQLRTRSLLNGGGFSANGVSVGSAGRLSLQVTAGGSGRTARVASRVLVAAGTRAVQQAGTYAVKVKVTRKGRQLLRRTRRLRATFTLRFTSESGETLKGSTRVMLRR